MPQQLMRRDEKINHFDGDDIYYQATLCVDIDFCDSTLEELERAEWESIILNVPKLRTYITYKNIYGAAEYVTQIQALETSQIRVGTV